MRLARSGPFHSRLAVTSLLAAMLAATPARAEPGPAVTTPDVIVWSPSSTLPAGSRTVILEGDPRGPGAYAMRAKLPAGAVMPPHRHDGEERVTVLEGTLHLGVGARVDRSHGRALPAGSYSVMPRGVYHYFWTEVETVIQAHGTGPWSIHFADPEHDPRVAATDGGKK